MLWSVSAYASRYVQSFTCSYHQKLNATITLLLLVRATYVWCCSSRTSRSWWITQSTQHHRRGCNNIPSFLQRAAPITRSLCEGWTPHDLHILVTTPFCCDRISRVACTQSFALWQQAAIEIMRRNLSSHTLVVMFNCSHVNIGRASTPRSLFYCLLAPHIFMVLFFMHIPFVVNHTINATPPERLQQCYWHV